MRKRFPPAELEDMLTAAEELCSNKEYEELQKKAWRYEKQYLRNGAGDIPGFGHPVYLVEVLASCHCGDDFVEQLHVDQPAILVQYVPVSFSCGAVAVPKGGFTQFPSIYENVPVIYIPGIVRK